MQSCEDHGDAQKKKVREMECVRTRMLLMAREMWKVILHVVLSRIQCNAAGIIFNDQITLFVGCWL